MCTRDACTAIHDKRFVVQPSRLHAVPCRAPNAEIRKPEGRADLASPFGLRRDKSSIQYPVSSIRRVGGLCVFLLKIRVGVYECRARGS
jgi:hypothetical protein